ncbi:CBS domain-containing protein CBSCBSPB2-like isoform X2 [Vicia villosa]|uniref:CBS domain-containing protein CBSCBSPB2-like isoform X2 n=1 Tax=Vicia villosa TaxID=3911 RepID=UPI00273B6826|nr:CBS domain-containing protein CBSCBSPB2-like isoform X2 [Vicia villosa]
MAARRVDAVLLPDSNALLSGIMTDKDIATRVIAEGLWLDQKMVSKVMTRNTLFVTSDTLAIEPFKRWSKSAHTHLSLTIIFGYHFPHTVERFCLGSVIVLELLLRFIVAENSLKRVEEGMAESPVLLRILLRELKKVWLRVQNFSHH